MIGHTQARSHIVSHIHTLVTLNDGHLHLDVTLKEERKKGFTKLVDSSMFVCRACVRMIGTMMSGDVGQWSSVMATPFGFGTIIKGESNGRKAPI